MVKIYIGLYMKYPLFLFDLLILAFLRQFFEKYSNIKFNENPSIGRPVPCGWTDSHGEANGRFTQLRTRLKIHTRSAFSQRYTTLYSQKIEVVFNSPAESRFWKYIEYVLIGSSQNVLLLVRVRALRFELCRLEANRSFPFWQGAVEYVNFIDPYSWFLLLIWTQLELCITKSLSRWMN
jgi:hypothetical protein